MWWLGHGLDATGPVDRHGIVPILVPLATKIAQSDHEYWTQKKIFPFSIWYKTTIDQQSGTCPDWDPSPVPPVCLF